MHNPTKSLLLSLWVLITAVYNTQTEGAEAPPPGPPPGQYFAHVAVQEELPEATPSTLLETPTPSTLTTHTLNLLPDHLITTHINPFLNHQDLCSLSSTSKQYREMLPQESQMQYYIQRELLSINLDTCPPSLSNLLLTNSPTLHDNWTNKRYSTIMKKAEAIGAEFHAKAINPATTTQNKIILLKHAILLGNRAAIKEMVSIIRSNEESRALCANELVHIYVTPTKYLPHKMLEDELEELIFAKEAVVTPTKDILYTLCTHNMFRALAYLRDITPNTTTLYDQLTLRLSEKNPSGWTLAVSRKERQRIKKRNSPQNIHTLRQQIQTILNTYMPME